MKIFVLAFAGLGLSTGLLQTVSNVDPQATGVPDPGIPGFAFPEADVTINNWVYGGAVTNQIQHAWGLWTAITMPTPKQIGGATLRAFETWPTPADIIAGKLDPLMMDLQEPMRAKGFRPPNQLRGEPKLMVNTPSGPDMGLAVSVAYNPPAARHALINQLFKASTLSNYLSQGFSMVPVFPSDSITIKPVWKLITQDKLNPQGLYMMPAWPGPPKTPQAYGQGAWNAAVYVDLKNGGKGNGKIDLGLKGPTPETTYNLDDFIYFQLNKADIGVVAKQMGLDPKSVQPGDTAILVAMHITSREIERWTWQTVWWSANADAPFEPSNRQISQWRPSQLKGAPRHYAMSVGYSMLEPAQPVRGGVSQGSPVASYNPYLEAGFGPNVFGWTKPIETPTGTDVMKYGVETNCMTCHTSARWDPKVDYSIGSNRETPYAANFYADLDDPDFKGTLQLDFAWSILGNLQLDK